ncbi:hypothetical protein F4781DRAFT_430015 [Annulohypoxylon bovei var. microspora]|nr:hypothetical protein F4781DRAFT_430015 [Annulohypoxylon bovei var. microspora]
MGHFDQAKLSNQQDQGDRSEKMDEGIHTALYMMLFVMCTMGAGAIAFVVWYNFTHRRSTMCGVHGPYWSNL